MLKGQMGESMLGSKSISLERMDLILSKFLFPRLVLLREQELLVSCAFNKISQKADYQLTLELFILSTK
jgi:hypothetical protein